MTSERISRRNRANAQKSTGPNTQEGKARVARNARKHGATAQPDPINVATWLAIIRGEPELEPQDLMPKDDRGYRALALAEAEVRLAASERALIEFEKEALDQPDNPPISLELTYQVLLDSFANNNVTKREVRSMAKLLYKDEARKIADASVGGRTHRLLKRYLAEAKSKRSKAFAAWLEIRHRHSAAT